MAEIIDLEPEDQQEDILPLAEAVALAALQGLTASGMEMAPACATAWHYPELFLRERGKWIAKFGG